MATPADIETAIAPLLSQESGVLAVDTMALEKGQAWISLVIDPLQAKTLEPLRLEIENRIKALKGIRQAKVVLTAEKVQEPKGQTSRPQPSPLLDLPGIKKIIAVASGKGGVGKSTVAVNLAMALKQQGLSVGLLDADIYGPSVPMLLGLRHQKPVFEDKKIVPFEAHGIKAMSMGFLVDEERPMIWRGPMVQSAVTQLLRDVAWGECDVLVLDLPPGTGDAQLTLVQKVKLTGAVIVSTPQDLALIDAIKAIHMFQKTDVPILGLVENMSVFCCPSCGTQTPIFGEGGAKRQAEEMGIAFLGQVPLDPAIRKASDEGMPAYLYNEKLRPCYDTIAESIKR